MSQICRKDKKMLQEDTSDLLAYDVDDHFIQHVYITQP